MSLGATEFRPLGVKTEFTSIDFEKKQAKANILYQGNVIVAVEVNILTNSLSKEGNFDAIAHLKDHGINEKSLLHEVMEKARLYIEEKITPQ
ncbi:hypothetical protein YDYSY3_26610 [Paenibacillus chitinolyticus]|uniref:hypothetical protein n=1 Tax=Paenibacillus chitinolyticus TaxID=79263 RepID=UPI0026E4B351|nr:hypothetical protein [Paenibacillus chitinolyticus]GKS11661.1 hypothetical protein YDYSY3_26610 [Paenibacillus chitinolyticus]